MMPPPFGTGDWELFDLKNDPAELHDLAAEHPARLGRLVARWEDYKAKNGVLDISFDVSAAR